MLATQNPVEMQGTYPLPEAQLDRFLLKLEFDYPDGEPADRDRDDDTADPVTARPAPIRRDAAADGRPGAHGAGGRART